VISRLVDSQEARPKLQLALDIVILEDALRVAERTLAHVDILEVGTPLVKACGLSAVAAFKTRFPDKPIAADMKTMDTGRLEAEIAFNAGADLVSVLGVACRETIAGAVEAARTHGGAVIVDSIGIADLEGLVAKIQGLNVDYLFVHTGIDQQHSGNSPFTDLDKLVGKDIGPRIGLVGGLNESNLAVLDRYPQVQLVVVGGAITNAEDPATAASRVHRTLRGLGEQRRF
jgi:3-hexulose-6-phosphate synthase